MADATADKSNVIVGAPKVSGGMSVAPMSAPLPTDVTAALDVAYERTGYVTDDGVVRSESKSVDTQKDWKGVVIKVLNQGATVTVKVTLAEYLNPTVQGLLYGADNVTVTAATATHGTQIAIAGHTGDQCPRRRVVLDLFDGDGAAGRVVFPDAQVTDIGDQTFKMDAIVGRELTFTLLADDSGAYFYEYWEKDDKTA